MRCSPVRACSRTCASESAVKNVRTPLLLHLATHAYFGAQDCAGQPQATDNPLLAQVEEGVTARETLWLFRILGQAACG